MVQLGLELRESAHAAAGVGALARVELRVAGVIDRGRQGAIKELVEGEPARIVFAHAAERLAEEFLRHGFWRADEDDARGCG